MKKKDSINKNLLKILILSIVTLIIIVACLGVYGKKLNKLSNLLPDYNYTTDIKGAREFKLIVDTSEEEKKVYVDAENNVVGEAKTDDEGNASEVEGYTLKTLNIKLNEEDKLNSSNYKKTKNIIENRLNSLGIQDYKIRLDRQTGNMTLELKQDKDTDNNYTLAMTKGKLEVRDYQNGIILIDNSNIKSVTPITNSTVTGAYSVYLQVTFDEKGAEKLKKISNNYISTVLEDGEENIKYISVELDGTALYTTYFNEEWTTNYIYIPLVENVVSEEELKEAYDSASKISNIINSGNLPIVYTLQSDNFVKSEITSEHIKLVEYICLGILIIFMIVVAIIFKLNGLLLGFINIGFVSILSIVLRFLKVDISISGIIAIFVMIAINTIFMIKILKNNKKELFWNIFKKYNFTILPVMLIAIIYTLTNNICVMSIGMILFWGIIVFEIYNIFVTKMFIEE